MKVNIGEYVTWIGPYKIASALRWVGVSEERHTKIGRWLNETWVKTACEYIYNKKSRKVKIHIDDYDVWDASYTMALIIHPILVKLKEDKQGIPFVDNEDVPEELRDEKDYGEKKWDYVLDEMIFAFEKLSMADWEDEFRSGDLDMQFIESDIKIGGEKTFQWVEGPNSTYEVDQEGIDKTRERIENGLKLFGKYYMDLWT